MRFCWIVRWAAVGAAVGGAVAARRGAVGARGGAAGDVSRQQVTTSRAWTTSRVLDLEWHHGQWQAMTQADRIFHTILRWLLVLLMLFLYCLPVFPCVSLSLCTCSSRRVLDSEWHHGQWQAMTQADRIFHTTLRWLLVLLIGTCTGLLAFLVNISVEAIGGAKFGLVFSHIKGQNMPAVLSAKTLIVKVLGSIAAVAGGLAVGKEGPLVHCGACIASILGRLSHWISARRDLSRPRKPRIQTANSFASLGLSPPGEMGLCLVLIRRVIESGWGRLGVIWALRTPVWVHSDRGLRDLVTCGAASEIAAAFLAPVGGVLFVLEQVTSWWRNSLIWRIFFTNAVVAMVLRACISLCEGDRCGGSFGSRGFILFDRSKSRTDFGLLEVVPVALLGIVGGLLGGLFNHLNVKLCAFRKSKLHRHGAWVRVLEVLLISLLTSALRFYGPFLASCLPCPQDPDEGGDLPQGSFNCPSIIGTGDHKAFACPDGQYNDLASLVFTTNDDAIGNLFRTGSFGIFTYSSLLLSFTTCFLLTTLTYGTAVTHSHTLLPYSYFSPPFSPSRSPLPTPPTPSYPSLLLSFTIYFLLATLTYGTAVPAGLFVPSILCGASYGRMAGMFMVTLFGPHRVGEGTYALLGAASFLGGSMRMTVSLSVILLELTGSLKLLPLVMVVLLVSKSVGDLFNRNIEDSHVDLKGIPNLRGNPRSNPLNYLPCGNPLARFLPICCSPQSEIPHHSF
ncbi:unnamed protein product [Closterium sp. Naga37s-1]|nr:unnamed protein product [Closterium sp. Naga37s-1]